METTISESDWDTPEAIRCRPGMYVGGIDAFGLHNLFHEILTNALVEVLASKATAITVVYNADNSLTVADNGRGIPVEVNAATGKVFAELIFTELNAAERYGYTTENRRSIGAASVNALSTWLEYEVRRDGSVYRQRFTRGVPDAPLAVVGSCGPEDHGTKVTWLADATVFTDALDENGSPHYDRERLRNRLRELAYLNKAVTCSFHDARSGLEPETYHFPCGLEDYVADLNKDKDVVHPEVIAFSDTQENVHVEIAFQYNQREEDTVYAYANTLETCLRGTHVEGFESGLLGVINRHAQNNGLLREGDAKFSRAAVHNGLTAVIAVRLANPMYPGATRERLGNPEVARIVRRITRERLSAYLRDNTQSAQAIINRMLSVQAHTPLRKNRKRAEGEA